MFQRFYVFAVVCGELIQVAFALEKILIVKTDIDFVFRRLESAI